VFSLIAELADQALFDLGSTSRSHTLNGLDFELTVDRLIVLGQLN
jgi:hypothetical protein